MKREFHEKKQQPLKRMGSLSLYDIDQVPKSLSPGSGSSDMTATTDSPTNDGYEQYYIRSKNKFYTHVRYISDDSTVSGTKVKFGSIKTQQAYPIEIRPSSKITRTVVTEKASFWQKRTENVCPLSDPSVNEDFPNAHFL